MKTLETKKQYLVQFFRREPDGIILTNEGNFNFKIPCKESQFKGVKYFLLTSEMEYFQTVKDITIIPLSDFQASDINFPRRAF